MSQNQLRELLRYSHLAAGGVLAVVVYSPLVDNSAALWLTRIVLVPFLVLGGLWMWIQSRAWASRAAAGRMPDATGETR
jgi:hypothetical protein